MMIYILNFIIEYLCYFVGAFIQILFILLPINLKNWNEDFLNLLTYIAFQGAISGILFIISPWFLEAHTISNWVLSLLIGGTCILALLRIFKTIPLEFTHPINLKLPPIKNLTFNEFFNHERRHLLETLDYQNPESEQRYLAFREKLIRLRTEKNETILESMIRNNS